MTTYLVDTVDGESLSPSSRGSSSSAKVTKGVTLDVPQGSRHNASPSRSPSRKGSSFASARRGTLETSPHHQPHNNGNLEDELTNEKLLHLEKVFEEADEDGGGGLDMDEFRGAMRQTMGPHVTDQELDQIFMKVDTNCDGTVDWDEYLTYMLLECGGKDMMQVQDRQPFPCAIQHVPSEHRDSIIRTLFIPQIKQRAKNVLDQDDEVKHDATKGQYLSVGKDGILMFWNIDMKPQCTQRVTPVLKTTKTIWVTDAVVLPSANVLVIATTARDIIFYDVNVNRFQRLSRIAGNEACPVTLAAFDKINDTTHTLLLWGDDKGGISALFVNTHPMFTALNPKRSKGKRERLLFAEMMMEHFENIKATYIPCVHNDTVNQIMYSKHLGCFISCCKDPETAMFVGDIDCKHTESTFKVPRGVNTFDYCKKMNVIVSGGYDCIVRVWNPYVPTKPIILLQGHKSPVLHVHINSKKEYTISIAENKEIRIHDLNTQTCVQTFFRKMVPNIGPRSITASYFHPVREALVFGTNILALLEYRAEEVASQAMLSHAEQVNVALYNPLFQKVVSAGKDGMVYVWNIFTGQKEMQFQAHRLKRNGVDINVEISSITFDPTQRRLFTSGRDGTVRSWNFNNGALLRDFRNFDHCEITSIIFAKQRVITAGWNRRLTMFMDIEDNEMVTWLHPYHKEDILSVVYIPPNIVSSSFDGDIFVWSAETCRLVYFFNFYKNYLTPTSPTVFTKGEETFPTTYVPQKESKLKGKIAAFGSQFKDVDSKPKNKSNRDDGKTQPDEVDDGKDFDDDYEYFGTPSSSRTSSRNDSRCHSSRRSASKKARKISNAEYSVEKLIVLKSRISHKETANLLSAGGDGMVRAWSVHIEGGFLGEFMAAHNKGATVSAMATNSENTFVITGDSDGYVKIFDISHFWLHGIECSKKLDLQCEYWWQEFAFVRWYRVLKKMGLVSRHFPTLQTGKDKPHIVNSFQAHRQGITCVDHFVSAERDFFVTASKDCSIRLWTIYGQFMGLFGQEKIWNASYLLSTSKAEQREENLMSTNRKPNQILVPQDIRKIASATTLRVLTSGKRNGFKLAKMLLTWFRKRKQICDIDDGHTDIDDDKLNQLFKKTRSTACANIEPKSPSTSDTASTKDVIPITTHEQVVTNGGTTSVKEQITVQNIPETGDNMRPVKEINKGESPEIEETSKKEPAFLDDLTKEVEPVSDILGKSYKRSTRHRPLPVLKKPIELSPQCAAFRALPFEDFKLFTWELNDNPELKAIRDRYKLPPIVSPPLLQMRVKKAFNKIGWASRKTRKSSLKQKQLIQESPSPAKEAQPSASDAILLPAITKRLSHIGNSAYKVIGRNKKKKPPKYSRRQAIFATKTTPPNNSGKEDNGCQSSGRSPRTPLEKLVAIIEN